MKGDTKEEIIKVVKDIIEHITNTSEKYLLYEKRDYDCLRIVLYF